MSWLKNLFTRKVIRTVISGVDPTLDKKSLNDETQIIDQGVIKMQQVQIVPQAGLTTSSGQFTAIFTLVALILGLLGYHYSPDKIETWFQTANTFLLSVGPLLAAVPVLVTYINSRGKIQSNAIIASTAPTTVVDATTQVGGATA